MESEFERSRIERIKRGLYDPRKSQEEYRDYELTPNKVDVNDDWKEEISQAGDAISQKKSKGIFVLKAMIVFAILVFVSAIGYFVYTVWDPFSKPSDRNIEFGAELPVAVSSGAISPVRLSVTNKNRVPLEYAVLTVIYPPGTKSGTEPDKDMRDDKKSLGEIASGVVAMYDQKVIFLGEENAQQDVKFRLEYRFRGINSIFTKEESRPLRLNSAPVNLTVNTLSEVNSGQTFDFEIIAISNTIIPLNNVVIKAEYPQGFQFIDSSVKPTFGDNAWNIGQLKPSDKLKIRVRGLIVGEDGQGKAFRTTVGVGLDQQSHDISTEYGNVLSTVVLRESFIGIKLMIDGKPAGDSIANFGKQIKGKVLWKNNLKTRIVNAEIDVKLKGTALNRRSIETENGGFYRSSDDTIFWDERGEQQLAVLDAGEEGDIAFSFLPQPPVNTTGQTTKNPEMTLEITVRGTRVSETGVPEEVKTVSIRKVRVTSDVQFASKAVYSVGPIVNRGPIPPKVGQETTYTIVWSIVNTSNDIANATVRAVIPPYAKFTGTVLPAKENIVYNDATKEIIWSPGNIAAGVGVGSASREVYFQMVLYPSLSQISTSPKIMYDQHFSAQDAYTGQVLEQTREFLDVGLLYDPKFIQTDGKVVP